MYLLYTLEADLSTRRNARQVTKSGYQQNRSLTRRRKAFGSSVGHKCLLPAGRSAGKEYGVGDSKSRQPYNPSQTTNMKEKKKKKRKRKKKNRKNKKERRKKKKKNKRNKKERRKRKLKKKK